MRSLWLVAIAACSAETAQLAPDAPAAATGIADIRCSTAPSLPGRDLRHAKNEIVVEMGEPRHRGIDLIAAATDETQTIGGAFAYSDLDKALEDEDIELFACTGPGWRDLGTATTDGDGRFALTLSGDARIDVGLRDLYAAAPDGTGAWFLAFVAPAGSPVLVTDIDGTLTSSETTFPTSTVVGNSVGVQPGAPAGFMRAAASGITPIFVTARGDLYSESTRQWLAAKGFPRAPMHLGQPIITLPGTASTDFKRAVIAPLVMKLDIVAAIGNRASDVTAYRDAGISGARIWMKLPEYAGELTAALQNHDATGFYDYASLSF
jgi:hypothetical protein